ncbi:Gfo/Idh/MocA family oxidoreductase [Salinibacterium sp. G-O1]|uniref:Gfo/Idh/MocA family protein n=1 Tax=Salinibacterium sp. G-O1 TaxID=3046208 RepID=UPI0024B90645|nr:Gfo/Idh/MocA family oxidoreductase [Salinibacterium sp. G-O1]MDJ0335250.1 Gfo/Idh/MocA family oxidoreductase [Salinibacterium sp. G-O1]
MDDIRWGLVGTGFWARETHAPSIAATAGATLASVWGRDPEATGLLADDFAARPFSDVDAFPDSVDAVSFAVPPHVQSEIALKAIRAGKHVLLEKPISVSLAAANELVAAAETSGVSTTVFFTLLFDPRMRAINANAEIDAWSGAQGLWLGSALMDENPFNTPWRHEKGAVWDLGPHAVSVLVTTLGPIVNVSATAGEQGLVHAQFTHASGATSTATMTLFATEAADGFSTLMWGPNGRQWLPVDDVDEQAAMRLALAELVDNIRNERTQHQCDLSFGRDIVAVLAAIESGLASQP